MGGRQLSRVPAPRAFSGSRSSSPLPSGGAGTKDTAAVHGPTRRPTCPAAAFGRCRPGQGRGSPCLPCLVRAGGPGVGYLLLAACGASRSPGGLGQALAGCLAGVAADELSGDRLQHRQRPRGSPHATAHANTHIIRPVRRWQCGPRQERTGWYGLGGAGGSGGPGASGAAGFPGWPVLAGGWGDRVCVGCGSGSWPCRAGDRGRGFEGR